MDEVGDFMVCPAPYVEEGAKIGQVAEFMNSNKIPAVLVKKNGSFVGMVTDADFTRKVALNRLPVDDTEITKIMSSPLISVDAATPMMRAHETMLKSRIRHLTVTRNGEIVGMLSVTDFFSYYRWVEEKLMGLSIRDGLTGVYNRRYFDEIIEMEWGRAAREKKPLFLIMVDIDFFKLYNDTYGHQAGDDCIKSVSRTMAESLRRPADVVARYGGEEFAVILPNTDSAGALKMAETIRVNILELKISHRMSETHQFVTASLGLASEIPAPNSSFQSLVSRADEALYCSKRGGRNQATSYIV